MSPDTGAHPRAASTSNCRHSCAAALPLPSHGDHRRIDLGGNPGPTCRGVRGRLDRRQRRLRSCSAAVTATTRHAEAFRSSIRPSRRVEVEQLHYPLCPRPPRPAASTKATGPAASGSGSRPGRHVLWHDRARVSRPDHHVFRANGTRSGRSADRSRHHDRLARSSSTAASPSTQFLWDKIGTCDAFSTDSSS